MDIPQIEQNTDYSGSTGPGDSNTTHFVHPCHRFEIPIQPTVMDLLLRLHGTVFAELGF